MPDVLYSIYSLGHPPTSLRNLHLCTAVWLMWEEEAVDRHWVIIQVQFMAPSWSKMVVKPSFKNILLGNLVPFYRSCFISRDHSNTCYWNPVFVCYITALCLPQRSRNACLTPLRSHRMDIYWSSWRAGQPLLIWFYILPRPLLEVEGYSTDAI